MNKAKAEHNKKLAVKLYCADKGGATSVYDACNDGTIKFDDWEYCLACDTDTPVIDHECLCCGQTTKPNNVRGQKSMTDGDRIEKLEREVYDLKVQLKLAKERVEDWKKAYDSAMTYAKKLLKKGVRDE